MVLKQVSNVAILASLPMRRDSIPTFAEVERGCVEIPDINVNCFIISPEEPITNCGKCFDFKTHLYGHQLDTYDIDVLKRIYPFEDSDYHVYGKMKTGIFEELIECLSNSKSVKRKFKRMLQA